MLNTNIAWRKYRYTGIAYFSWFSFSFFSGRKKGMLKKKDNYSHNVSPTANLNKLLNTEILKAISQARFHLFLMHFAIIFSLQFQCNFYFRWIQLLTLVHQCIRNTGIWQINSRTILVSSQNWKKVKQTAIYLWFFFRHLYV